MKERLHILSAHVVRLGPVGEDIPPPSALMHTRKCGLNLLV